MREIKFRAWIHADKRMERSLDVCHCNCIDYSIDENTVERKQIGKECELMQFTGLHDKNGKEIYEGDIVRIGKINFRIVWCEWSFGLTWVGLRNEVQTDVAVRLYDIKTKGGEVIGNKHENPELLKEKK